MMTSYQTLFNTLLPQYGINPGTIIIDKVLSSSVLNHADKFILSSTASTVSSSTNAAAAAIIPTFTTPSFFLGNGGKNWPDDQRLEYRLSILSLLSLYYPQGYANLVHVATPLRTNQGNVTIKYNEYRYYVAPYYPGSTLKECESSEMIAPLSSNHRFHGSIMTTPSISSSSSSSGPIVILPSRSIAIQILAIAIGSYHRMVATLPSPSPTVNTNIGDTVRNVPVLGKLLYETFKRWSTIEPSCNEVSNSSNPSMQDITWKKDFTKEDHKLVTEVRNILNFLCKDNEHGIEGTRFGRIQNLDNKVHIHDDAQLKNILYSGPPVTSVPTVVDDRMDTITNAPNIQTTNNKLSSSSSPLLSVASLLPPHSLTIVDITDGTYTSRLFDFYYLVIGGEDDSVNTLACPPNYPGSDSTQTAAQYWNKTHLVSVFYHYFRYNPVYFSAEERLLLINALQFKSSMVAEYFAKWAPVKESRTLFQYACYWILYFNDQKEIIREAIDEAIKLCIAENEK